MDDVCINRTTLVLDRFYRVARAGQQGMTDGGGPFGFDITVALLADELITGYRCDAVIETGCYLGDTTAYLGTMYPHLPVRTCDVWQPHADFTAHRLRSLSNVAVTCRNSPQVVARACREFQRPFIFLDAHGGTGPWPLAQELAEVSAASAIVMIHDFNVGHPRFSYDTYAGVECGPNQLSAVPRLPPRYYTPDPMARWPLPCLQTGRRSGIAVLSVGLDDQVLRRNLHLVEHQVSAAEAVLAV